MVLAWYWLQGTASRRVQEKAVAMRQRRAHGTQVVPHTRYALIP